MVSYISVTRNLIHKLLDNFGQTYSEELGINLKSKKSSEIFKWFLASILFGARISETIAKNTYRALVRHGWLTPQKIQKTSWEDLIHYVMGEGGYVRYDGKTSAKLHDVCGKLISDYNANLNNLHEAAKDSADLERRLQEFKGIGPTTTNIFLRELRGIWKKANPELSPFVLLAAKKLKIADPRKYWMRHKVKGYRFSNFEAALLRLGKDWFRKGKKLDLDI